MSVEEYREWASFLTIEREQPQQSGDEMLAAFRAAYGDRIVKRPN